MKVLVSFLFLIACITTKIDASYCGQAGVPFSLEALSNGQPVLGCARPTCFGWNANGTRSADVAQFYTIGKKPDGFFRKTDFKGPIVKDLVHFQPQFSYCDRGYLSPKCSKDQWVGGIAPLGMINASTNFQLMCCTYSKLSQANEDSEAEIRGGQSVVGGEVRDENGKQVSFEYIANIERNFDSKGVFYKVSLRRFSCPEQNETTIPDVETSTSSAPESSSNVELSQSPQELQSKPTFDATKFDLPKDMPQEDTEKADDFRGRKAAGEKTFSNTDGSSIGSYPNSGFPQARPMDSADAIRGPYPPESYQGQVLSQYPRIAPQPYQLTQQVYQPPQAPQSSVYQPSLLDPLGIFTPRTASAPGVQAPTQQVIQPIIQRVPTVGQNGQWYAQPGPYAVHQQQGLYNPQNSIFPTNGLANGQAPIFSAYNQNVVAQAAPTSQQVAPIKIPSVEEVENSIPSSGRKILTHVANAFLNKKIK